MRLKFFWVIIFVSVLAISPKLYAAVNDRLGMIDKNDTYDIYYGGTADGTSFIAKRVKVMRIEQINGVDFLVFINDSGFNAKMKEGFTLFETIKAIVPNSTFTIIGNERLK